MKRTKISFVGKPMFYKPGVKGGVYPCRLSSRVRAEEVAAYLGAEYSQDGICKYGHRIYLKPRTYKHIRDGDYVDVLDNLHYMGPLKRRPGIKLLSMCQLHHDYLKKELENEVYLIYHHHINFENEKRVKNKALIGGMIGKGANYVYRAFDEIKAGLKKVGIGFDDGGLEYRTRQDMLDFFHRIDFLVIWYPNIRKFRESPFVHPGKIVNAASFGIPTISQYIKAYQELWADCLQAETKEEIVKQAVRLQDDSYYHKLSQRLLERAKDFHISKTTEKYKKLWK